MVLSLWGIAPKDYWKNVYIAIHNNNKITVMKWEIITVAMKIILLLSVHTAWGTVLNGHSIWKVENHCCKSSVLSQWIHSGVHRSSEVDFIALWPLCTQFYWEVSSSSACIHFFCSPSEGSGDPVTSWALGFLGFLHSRREYFSPLLLRHARRWWHTHLSPALGPCIDSIRH